MIRLLAYIVFLPLVLNGSSPTVGVETEARMSSVSQYYNPSTALKVSVRGSDVLASPLTTDWSTLDNKLAGYHADWITVKMRPVWMGDGEICELPAQEHWYRYAVFIRQVVARYQPDYIEIWNEPDTFKEHMPADHYPFYGCIGDGHAYGSFADYLYPRISGRGARIVIGATSSIYSGFILDALDEVGTDYDGISFHCYAYFYKYVWNDCRETYEYATALTDKPVYLSETAVFYKTGTEVSFEAGQVEHYCRMKELPTVWYWYTLANNGWPAEMPTDICPGRPVCDVYMSENREP